MPRPPLSADLAATLRERLHSAVLGDEDGVPVIPAGALAEAVERALVKLGIEDAIGARLERGEATRAMFDEFGVM